MGTLYEYMDETSINSELICSICKSPFVDPIQTSCDETFCRQCITTWIQRRNTSCPLCRRPLSIKNFTQPTRMIRNMLNQLKIKCLICGQINLERGYFDDHIQRICSQMMVSCPSSNTNCLWNGPRQQLNQHLTTLHPDINQQLIHQGSEQINNATQSQHHQESHELNNSSLNITNIIIGSLIIFIIICCLFGDNSSTKIAIETTTIVDNKAIAMPISCTNMAQCSSQNVPFEHSYILTHEHQNYLNYFYNDTDSRIAKWILIYRGSIHGLNAASFHTHCDNKGETYIILSSTKGYLFGGYVDANWTTSFEHVPIYSSSKNAFIFSLMNPEKIPAKKFSLDKRYESYAIVNDISSGPIFGGMNLPDIGTYESNGQFRCQIHFPSVYMSGIGVSSFPSSHDCIINEMEVFIPVFKQPTRFWFLIFKIILSISITCIAMIIFGCVSNEYNANNPVAARMICCFALVFLWPTSLYGQSLLLDLLLILFVIGVWEEPNRVDLSHIRYEKRFVLLCFIVLLTCMILFF